jgi:hypothetical protein
MLGERIAVRVAYEEGDAGLLTVAISTNVRPGSLPLPHAWLGVILAGFFPHTLMEDVAGVVEIAGQPLRDDELGFCALLP